jgi:hypothetical protein
MIYTMIYIMVYTVVYIMVFTVLQISGDFVLENEIPANQMDSNTGVPLACPCNFHCKFHIHMEELSMSSESQMSPIFVWHKDCC